MRVHELSRHQVFSYESPLKIGQIFSNYLVSNLYEEAYLGTYQTHILLNHKMAPSKQWPHTVGDEFKLSSQWIMLSGQYITKKST